jgi:hypothetical protein
MEVVENMSQPASGVAPAKYPVPGNEDFDESAIDPNLIDQVR